MKKVVLIAGIFMMSMLISFAPVKKQRLKNQETYEYFYELRQENIRREKLERFENLLTVYNNNPFNIRDNNFNNWQGEVNSLEPFERFLTLDHGIRAGFKLLINYQDTHGLKSIEEIVHRFAPPFENNTESYINWMCKWTGFERTSPIDLRKKENLIPFSKFMIEMETGKPIDRRKLERVFIKYFT